MNSSIFSHKSGKQVIPQHIQDQITKVIASVTAPIQHNGATRIRKEIISGLQNLGWSDMVKLDPSSNISITSVYENIGACVQLGNVGRIYADLLKLQALFLRGSIRAGVIIVPKNSAARILGQNITNSERLIREVEIFSTVLTLPLLIVGFDE